MVNIVRSSANPSKKTHFRACLASMITEKISEDIETLKKERICTVSPEARLFIESLLAEATRVRLSEGERTGIQVDDPVKLAHYLAEVTHNILLKAATSPQYQGSPTEPVVSLISVIETINDQWCNIWPFCR